MSEYVNDEVCQKKYESGCRAFLSSSFEMKSIVDYASSSDEEDSQDSQPLKRKMSSDALNKERY
jgi:hypothetical protein